MKDLRQYINESTESEDLQEEVGLALQKFGNVRKGFKMVDKQSIIDAMYNLGFDFDDTNSDDEGEQLTFVGDYIDTKYEVALYIDTESGNKVKIRNFNVFEI